jgi:HTH-type transcriptional regulator / antitoxin MqsA
MKSTANLTECPICGSSKSVALRRGRFEATYNKVPITLEDVESYVCESCGEEFFTKEQDREVSQRVLEAARQKLGVLSPERVVTIRKKLNLSQEDMEELLDLGDKVVTRWETGRVVPGKTTDTLLRLLERKPELVDELRAIRREMPTLKSTGKTKRSGPNPAWST